MTIEVTRGDAPIKGITLHSRSATANQIRQIEVTQFGGDIFFMYERDATRIGGELIESKEVVRVFAQALLDLCNQ